MARVEPGTMNISNSDEVDPKKVEEPAFLSKLSTSVAELQEEIKGKTVVKDEFFDYDFARLDLSTLGLATILDKYPPYWGHYCGRLS